LTDVSGGHWENLAAVKKLTQSTQIPGYVVEDVKRNNPAGLVTVCQANHTGSSIKWLRQDPNKKSVSTVKNIAIGGATVWSESVNYNEHEVELRACYTQQKLDRFIPAIYGTFNNYEEVMYQEMSEGVIEKIGDKILYDDYTYSSDKLEIDGWHAIAAEVADNTLNNLDGGETALSLEMWRILSDAMKYGVDFWLIPYCIGRRLDAMMQEKGLAGLAYNAAATMGNIQFGWDEMGKKLMYFDGAPIIRSDFLVAEQANTGQGSDARAKYSSGTAMYSIFGVKLGKPSLLERDPGYKLCFGQPESDVDTQQMGDGNLTFLEYFSKLEGWIGKGMRMTSWITQLPGSSMCIGRIYDITNAAVTV
jgi:hypothetical protein